MLTVVYQVNGLSGSDSDSDSSKAYLVPSRLRRYLAGPDGVHLRACQVGF